MDNAQASIVTIGDELLIGQTVDTNSAWLGSQLNQIGIWVRRRVAVGDKKDDILQVLEQEGHESNIVLITGGLGPTADDITKPVLCDFFGGTLVTHQPTKRHVEEIFRTRGLVMLQRNIDQSLVPSSCQVLFNRMGTAPGMWFCKNDVVFIFLPGVPLEMKTIMLDFGLDKLKSMGISRTILHRTLLTTGMGESFVAERLTDFEKSLGHSLSLAYLPGGGLLKLRLTQKLDVPQSDFTKLSAKFDELKSILHDIAVYDEDIPLEELVGRQLKKLNITVSTAESCTGGLLAHKITSVPGSSDYFQGSLVAYSNRIKKALLHVPLKVLEQFGAVSEETVLHMASAAQELFETDMAIAVSGIMGPGGGANDKPVGTVWLAVKYQGISLTQKHMLRYDRPTNTLWTVNYALCLALKVLG